LRDRQEIKQGGYCTNKQNSEKFSEAIKCLEEALNGKNAHASFEEAVADVPEQLLGVVPEGLPYSIWQLAEHIRITQWDILEFSRNKDHVSPPWPEGYWPKEKAPVRAADWKRSVDRIVADRKAFTDLLGKAEETIYEPLPWGEGQSLFREAVLIIDHTSYHTAEIIVLRRFLKNWK
jgi:hypothetical protein